jgi:hypothetical protein
MNGSFVSESTNAYCVCDSLSVVVVLLVHISIFDTDCLMDATGLCDTVSTEMLLIVVVSLLVADMRSSLGCNDDWIVDAT